jgi:type IV pilus assembly protein PilX
MTFPLLSHRSVRRSFRAMARRQAQRGVTLIFALITLVALLLATLALVRSVDTSTILMGNIGFKQDATVTADQATKVALSWLSTKSAVLNTDSLAQSLGQGYYASTKEIASDGTTRLDPVDVTGQQIAGTSRQVLDWTHDDCTTTTGYLCSVAVATTGSNKARYVIFRLCSLPGDYTSTGYTGACAVPPNGTNGTASARGELNYAETGRFGGSSGPYYRIVVRVQGARNTTSFTETIVHL